MGAGAGGCLLVIVIVALVVGAFLIPTALGNLQDAQAQRDLARAELERARSDREHQAAVDWQRDFMLWTVAMKASGADVIAVVVLGLAALGGGYWLGRRGPEQR